MTCYDQHLNEKPEVARKLHELQSRLTDANASLEDMDAINAEIVALRAAHPECFPTDEEEAAARAWVRNLPAAKRRK